MTETSATARQTFINREGASLRTADELSVLFVEDAVSLGAELSPFGSDVFTRAVGTLEASRSPRSGTAWLDDEDLSDDLATLVNQMETELDTLGYAVEWEDGYTITDYSQDDDERHPDDL